MPIRTVVFLALLLVSVLEVLAQTGPTVTTQETIALPAQTVSVVNPARFHRMTTSATPAGANLGRYPLKAKRLTRQEEVDLGLRTVALRYDWTGFNYHREVEGGRWVWEKLPAGTLVHVDETGNQLYKEDCGNRLVWWPSDPFGRPVTIPLTILNPVSTTRVEPFAGQAGGNNVITRLGDFFRSLAGNVWKWFGDWLRMLGWLLLFLIPIAIFLFLVWAFNDLIHWLDERSGGRQLVATQQVTSQGPVSGPRMAPRGLARILPWRWVRSGASRDVSRPTTSSTADVQAPAEGTRSVRPTTTRRFMTFSSSDRSGDPDERIRFGGYRRVDLNIDPDTDGAEVTTIRLYRS